MPLSPQDICSSFPGHSSRSIYTVQHPSQKSNTSLFRHYFLNNSTFAFSLLSPSSVFISWVPPSACPDKPDTLPSVGQSPTVASHQAQCSPPLWPHHPCLTRPTSGLRPHTMHHQPPQQRQPHGTRHQGRTLVAAYCSGIIQISAGLPMATDLAKPLTGITQKNSIFRSAR